MKMFQAIALAGALTFSTAGVALAEGASAIDSLTSASTISFQTVGEAKAISVRSGGFGTELVDLDSLKARILNNPRLAAQLYDYGASIDDVVGIAGSSPADVTVYVLG